MSITIIKAGLLSSVQDLGRWGFQQYGVPIGGAMDKISASIANFICGNDEHEAVIEMTLHGTEIMFNEQAYCALSGGGCKVYINDVELPFNRLLDIPAFSIIKMKYHDVGCRSYLSISGGLDIRKELGSTSTYASSGIGGIHGRNLVTGDLIHFKNNPYQINKASLKSLSNNISVSSWEVQHVFPLNLQQSTINCIKGPEYELFDDASSEAIFNTTLSISNMSNRMGYHLEGASFALKEKHEMVSTPVTAGIIQVTNQGKPIILMADAQTTGGYPRIARVCASDIPLLAQLRPGDKIQFHEISEEESEMRYFALVEVIKKIKQGLKTLLPNNVVK